MAGMMMTAQMPRMRKAEALGLVKRIRSSLRDCRLWLLDLYEREGWRALGYASWREFARLELEQSERHLYRILTAAKIDRELTNGHTADHAPRIPESHARELAKLPTAELRAEVYAEANADGDTSAAEIRELVREHQGQARTEHLRIVNDRPDEDDVDTRPTPSSSSSRDPVAVILLRCQDARRYHRDLGDRGRAADAAMDSYLAIVRGE